VLKNQTGDGYLLKNKIVRDTAQFVGFALICKFTLNSDVGQGLAMRWFRWLRAFDEK
jgi:hypothetical protein